MPQDRLALRDKNSQFYRDNYRQGVILAIVLASICLLLVGFIFYQKFTAPTAPFFATTTDGRLIEITPLQ